MDENKIPESNIEDLKKAVAFLLSKELKDFSTEKKRDFLMQKLPKDAVEKAFNMLPLIEGSIQQKVEEVASKFEKENEKTFFSSFFDIGLISSVLLATLGINYVLDLNRNRKNNLFFKECEKKFAEQLENNAKEVKAEISKEISNYPKSEDVVRQIQIELESYSQKKGLTLSLTPKTVKEELRKIKEAQENQEATIKLLTEQIEKTTQNIELKLAKDFMEKIEENNRIQLKQIIETQNKLLEDISNLAFANKLETKRDDRITSNTPSLKTSQLELNLPTNSNENKFMNIEENIQQKIPSNANRDNIDESEENKKEQEEMNRSLSLEEEYEKFISKLEGEKKTEFIKIMLVIII
jgi:hypothetical protein